MTTPREEPLIPKVGLLMAAIYKKELRVLFFSPMASVFLAAFLFLGGIFFYLGVAMTGEASLRPMMSNLGITLVFCLPMVTMRSFADEARTGTLELLMTAPIPLWVLVVAKWLAVMTLCAVLVLLTGAYGVVLVVYGDPDLGVLLTSYLGLLICCGGFSAAGLFASSLTRDPMVAGVSGVLILLPFWLASVSRGVLPDWAEPVIANLSFLDHLRSFAVGVIDTGDLVWFASFIGLFLFLTWRALESRRWR